MIDFSHFVQPSGAAHTRATVAAEARAALRSGREACRPTGAFSDGSRGQYNAWTETLVATIDDVGVEPKPEPSNGSLLTEEEVEQFVKARVAALIHDIETLRCSTNKVVIGMSAAHNAIADAHKGAEAERRSHYKD